jgi:radical SAM protein with 4Fe4S-binding SPASM domain
MKKPKVNLYNQDISYKDIWILRKSILKSLFRWRRIFNFFMVIITRFFKNTKLISYPVSAMIEPTSRCNLKCPMCINYQNELGLKRGDMSFDNFIKAIDEVKRTCVFLFLWNSGEPLMNKELDKMIDYAKKANLFIIMSTNGYFLDKEKARMLIDKGLDYLIISFDGATKETYEKIRINSDYDKVINNIGGLIEEKKRQKKNLPFINLQFLIMRENEHEINKVASLGKLLKVDRITIKKTQIINEKLKKDLLPTKMEYTYEAYENQSICKENWCYKPWEHIVINWKGLVFPCCDTLDPNYSLGDLFSNGGLSLQEIWNNDKYVKFRKQILKDIDKIDICRICPKKTSSNELIILSDL